MVTRRGVTVVRHDGDGESWTMAHAAPHPVLAGVVARPYCGYVERTAAPFRRREVATGFVTLILSFSEPLDLVEMSRSSSGGRRFTSFVAGLHEGYAVTEHGGRQQGVQVDLTPLGAARLLGVPPHAVANACTGLDDLWGAAAGRLTDRLGSADGWAARFAILDDELLARAGDGPDPDPAVAWAWHQLAASHGQVPVGVLADEIGWSRRHFTARFRTQVGLSPKPTARVLRFRRAVNLLRSGPVRSIADLAAACGYADHSHLVREFRSLGGCTPSDFVRAELPGSGGTAA
ncbi:MAG TPA: helix-turn-helix domain-containing protein [Acidimicrobiales bacterium]|nr:helix-turn-helix domain-containing protein [Acidimicrobiales bacterium]